MTLKDIEKKLEKEIYFRSCWKCNPAHRHLKKADYIIYCFECGNIYYKGKKLKIDE